MFSVLQLARGPDGGWRRVAVWMAVPQLVQYRCLAGDERLLAFAETVLDAASLPEDRTWESWLEEQAMTRWANGHDRAFVPVDGEPTIERLFEREVLGRKLGSILSPELRPTAEPPTDLGGWKQIPRE